MQVPLWLLAAPEQTRLLDGLQAYHAYRWFTFQPRTVPVFFLFFPLLVVCSSLHIHYYWCVGVILSLHVISLHFPTNMPTSTTPPCSPSSEFWDSELIIANHLVHKYDLPPFIIMRLCGVSQDSETCQFSALLPTVMTLCFSVHQTYIELLPSTHGIMLSETLGISLIV